MAGQVKKIVEQLQRAWDGEAFHGTPVRTLLEGVGAAAAFARPLGGAHSIAEIARHIGTWEDIVRRRLAGEVIDQVADEVDWPGGEATPAAWDATLRWLDETHARLEGAVAALPEGRLGEPVAARDYDVQYMLQGILQHTLYHAGQIALLTKAAAAAA
jgi:uncharacterized damage-inducible protein DinB